MVVMVASALAALVIIERVPIMRALGWILVVDDPLEPASAILVLGGGAPYRALEAAALYSDGWARRVVLVPGVTGQGERALLPNQLPEWQWSRDLLVAHGVAPSDISVVRGEASNTLEELREAANSLGRTSKPIILVTSGYHGRRALLTWRRISDVPAIIRLQRQADRELNDPDHWWESRWAATAVLHEYLALVNLNLGSPLRGVPPLR